MVGGIRTVYKVEVSHLGHQICLKPFRKHNMGQKWVSGKEAIMVRLNEQCLCEEQNESLLSFFRYFAYNER